MSQQYSIYTTEPRVQFSLKTDDIVGNSYSRAHYSFVNIGAKPRPVLSFKPRRPQYSQMKCIN